MELVRRVVISLDKQKCILNVILHKNKQLNYIYQIQWIYLI